MPGPSALIQRLLSTFAGTWSIQEHYEPTAAMPKPEKGSGQEVWRPGPGGHSVIEEYRSTGAAGDFQGMAVIWVDEAGKGYRTVWCSSDNPEGCILMTKVGVWEGESLVLGDVRVVDGKRMVLRETFTEIRPSSFTQILEMGESEVSMKPFMTIHAKRVPNQ